MVVIKLSGDVVRAPDCMCLFEDRVLSTVRVSVSGRVTVFVEVFVCLLHEDGYGATPARPEVVRFRPSCLLIGLVCTALSVLLMCLILRWVLMVRVLMSLLLSSFILRLLLILLFRMRCSRCLSVMSVMGMLIE